MTTVRIQYFAILREQLAPAPRAPADLGEVAP
jgi:hypothetical protein